MLAQDTHKSHKVVQQIVEKSSRLSLPTWSSIARHDERAGCGSDCNNPDRCEYTAALLLRPSGTGQSDQAASMGGMFPSPSTIEVAYSNIGLWCDWAHWSLGRQSRPPAQ
jgi:hypothetical protein